MKIAILIPSRNRPRMLSAAITALSELQSGENEVEYRVGFDEDDGATYRVLHDLNLLDHSFLAGKDTFTIGQIWNGLAKEPADIYSCMIDDAFPITPHWDREMVRLASQFQALSWYEVSAPQNCGYPTCTKVWLDKVGYIVPEHFPFWFMDTWFAEMVQFVTGQGVPVSTQMALYSKQEATQNLRDLDFWWGFFYVTRRIRIQESFSLNIKDVDMIGAFEVGQRFEEFINTRMPFINSGQDRDMEFRGERIKELESDRGVKSKPSFRYLLAKRRAEEYLEKNGLKLWQ